VSRARRTTVDTILVGFGIVFWSKLIIIIVIVIVTWPAHWSPPWPRRIGRRSIVRHGDGGNTYGRCRHNDIRDLFARTGGADDTPNPPRRISLHVRTPTVVLQRDYCCYTEEREEEKNNNNNNNNTGNGRYTTRNVKRYYLRSFSLLYVCRGRDPYAGWAAAAAAVVRRRARVRERALRARGKHGFRLIRNASKSLRDDRPTDRRFRAKSLWDIVFDAAGDVCISLIIYEYARKLPLIYKLYNITYLIRAPL